MEFHVITPRGSELLMRVVDGQVVIVPPPVGGTTPAQGDEGRYFSGQNQTSVDDQ